MRRWDVRSGELPGGVVVRRLAGSDSIAELTKFLHRAYGGLAERGLRFVATHQSDDTTLRRTAAGECFVATLDDRLIGTVTLRAKGTGRGCDWYQRPNVACCEQLGVEPDLRGRGVGTLLLDVVEQRAWETGADEIALDTAEEAGDLTAWYRRRGYRFVEEADWDVTNYRSVVLSKSLALGPVSTRPAVESDRRVLAAMLVECVNWDQGRPRLSAIQVASRPKLWRYASGWSPPRDQGVIAEDGIGTPVGAAWWRYFPSTEPGFGFVAGDVPEVSIAVPRPWRGHGVGRRLLGELERVAAHAGVTALSLSVEASNPAVRLYRRLGYEETATIDGSHTMRLDVPASPGGR